MRKNFVQYLQFIPVNLSLISTFYPESGNEYAWIIFLTSDGQKIRWKFDDENRHKMMPIYRQLLEDMNK